MTRSLTTIVALILCFATNTFSQNFYYAPEGKAFLKVSTEKILVKFKPGTDLEAQQQILGTEKQIAELQRDMLLPAPEVTLVDLNNVSSESEVYALLERLQKNEQIEYANHFLAHKDGTLHGVTDQVVVRLRADGDLEQLRNFATNYGAIVEGRNEFDGFVYHVKVTANAKGNALELANALYETKFFDYAEPDFLRLMKRFATTNDTFLGSQWSLNNTGQNGGTPGADMKVFNAWDNTTGSSGIKVAIIDEGVDLSHPDLAGNMEPGYDATGQGSGGAPQGDDAHGTACAGIVAAVGNNNLGVAGVAYGSRIVPVRIAYSSGPNWVTNNTWIANAMNWAWQAQNGNADVLSNSWGGGGSSSLINGAIDGAVNNGRGGLGAPVLFAAGNDNGANSYPATYAPTISVIAMSPCYERKNPSSCDGETWWGSNYGTGADIAAPGVLIYATDISGSAGYSSGDYVSNFNGTSSATPNSSGVMALILSADPSLTEDQARVTLESTCDKVGGYTYNGGVSGQPNGTWSTSLGYGLINAEAALNSLTPPGADDAGISAVNEPSGSVCGTSAVPEVVLRNYGTNTLTSVTINYDVDGGTNNTYNWSGSLANGATTTVTLSSVSFSTGSHTLNASTSSPNGGADSNTNNDAASGGFSSSSDPNPVTLTIVLDNYPEETSWDIKDGGTTLASGGTYGQYADGSTLIISMCMPNGCFDFTIYDSYGDGICCGYGNGSYELKDESNGSILASGGQFGSSETTNFCVSSGPPPLTVSITGSTEPSCNGGSDGTATASASGGSGSYTYSWNGGSGSGATVTGLAAGNYTVTVDDGNTTATDNVTIGQPSAVSVSANATATSCATTNDGTASAGASGGTPGYSYNWTGPGGYTGSGANISGLAAGTYYVTATDSKGCIATGSAVVNAGTGGTTFYHDGDGDGFGDPNDSEVACSAPANHVTNDQDCDDTNAEIKPGAIEVCDGVDNNCDGNIDEGLSNTYYRDADGDTYGDASNTKDSCSQPAGYVSDNTDCDDSNPAVNPGAIEICGDGIDNDCANGDEPCGGGGCSYTVLEFNDFESSSGGWDIWNDGGSDCRRSSNDANYAWSGTYCVRIRDNTNSSVMTTDNLNLSAYNNTSDSIKVEFYFYAVSMENNEDFWLQVSDNGGSFNTVASWARGVNFNNNTFYVSTVTLAGPFSSNTRFRFRCDASANGDRVYIDDVEISGCSNGGQGGQAAMAGFGNDQEETKKAETTIQEKLNTELASSVSQLNLFPNPTSDQLTIAFKLAEAGDVNLMVTDFTGKVIQYQQLFAETGEQQTQINTQRMMPGYYFVHLISNGERVSKKFVVMR